MEEIGTQRIQWMGQGEMGLGILGQRQVTPMWANDPVWLYNGVDGRLARGGFGNPHPRRKYAEDGKGRSGLRRIVILRNN